MTRHRSGRSDTATPLRAHTRRAPFRAPATTQAARASWADLVHYARVEGGGDAECAAGRSFRYGVGVSYIEHKTYLASIGLTPERASDGKWYGLQPDKRDPLDDPAHPFAAFYAAEREAAARRGAESGAA